jgi:hypothetical protein
MIKIFNPYEGLSKGQWMRGNLHCHSTRSDGSRPPQGVIDDYARRGYDFLMLSDHDVFSSPEDYAQWDARGMLLINGNEVSAGGVHILHVDADRRVEPAKRRQQVIEEVNKTKGFTIVAHPNWTNNFDHCPAEKMLEWTGYLGVEVYNGLVEWHSGSAYGDDKWDMALSEGKRIWGFANDDSHTGVHDIQLGWNVVYTHDKSVKGLIEAMRAGRFYPSTGVTIADVKVEGDKITITTKDAHRIAAILDHGRRFACVDASTMTITVPEGATYVRFECFGVGERMAWTQPFFIERPEVEKAKEAAALPKEFIMTWDVSSHQFGLKLADAKLQTPANASLGWVKVTSEAQGRSAGFMDIRERTQSQPGVAYLSAVVKATKAQTGRVYLGFDGPVKAWLNETLIFQGPGSNPAIIDRIGLFADFKAGENRLTVAFDTNNGKGWGIYGRVELD